MTGLLLLLLLSFLMGIFKRNELIFGSLPAKARQHSYFQCNNERLMELQYLWQNFLYSWNGPKWLEPRLKCSLLCQSSQVARMPAYCVILNMDSFTQCAGRQSTHRVKILDFISCLCRECVLGGESVELTLLQYARCSFLYTVNNKKIGISRICNNLTVVISFAFSCRHVKTQCTFVLLCMLSEEVAYVSRAWLYPTDRCIYLMSTMFKQSCTWHCSLIYCVFLFLLLELWQLCLLPYFYSGLSRYGGGGLTTLSFSSIWFLWDCKSWGKYSEVPRLL